MKSKKQYDLAIIGGGPGGMAAAVRAKELGIEKVLIIERDSVLGGILPQCIHSGFGLDIFNEELTGPEYAQIFIDKISKVDIDIFLNTMALKIDSKKNIVITNKENGINIIKTKSVILALGCRERTRGAINIPGSRPAGIYTAGLVQRMVNIEGYLPGKEIIILGSGDIGLIMARRLKLEGCNVKGVFELMPFSTGLKRNIVQCLNDYNTPLFLSHTVTNIFGNERIEGVEISEVNKNFEAIPNTKRCVTCDTLVLSIGLIPENELSKTANILLDEGSQGPIVDEYLETSIPGIFSCGNSLFVNDLVDNVTKDGYLAAESAALFLDGGGKSNLTIEVKTGNNIAYVIPQRITGTKDVTFRIRPKEPNTDAVIKIPEINFNKKVKFVNPGELIFLKVSKEFFKKSSLKKLNSIEIGFL